LGSAKQCVQNSDAGLGDAVARIENGQTSALKRINHLRDCQARAGLFEKSKYPATCGAAIEVPWRL